MRLLEESHCPTQFVIEADESGTWVARGLEIGVVIADDAELAGVIELMFDLLRLHAPCEITIPDGRQWHLETADGDWRAVHRSPL
jgi:hypothetical protein